MDGRAARARRRQLVRGVGAVWLALLPGSEAGSLGRRAITPPSAGVGEGRPISPWGSSSLPSSPRAGGAEHLAEPQKQYPTLGHARPK